MSGLHRSAMLVGLTGGIGSGKTTVTKMLSDLGVEIIDADVISRQIVEPGSPALTEIALHFGNEVMQADGSLNRRGLRNRIFNDKEAKSWLENLLHPLIRAEIGKKINASTQPWLIISAALLLESDQYDFLDSVIVVDTPESLQIERTAKRDQHSVSQVEAIMATQLSRQQRLSRADFVIHNDKDLPYLQQQVSLLSEKLKELANERHQTS